MKDTSVPVAPRHLAVTGVMGTGKTTAARLLADAFDFLVIEENADENAFLPRFYAEPKRWAFHTQMAYLEARARRLRAALAACEKRGLVEDTPMLQNYLSYAKAQYVLGSMTGEEFTLYKNAYHILTAHLPNPDLIVSLELPFETVRMRIKKRGRDYEQHISPSYLDTLLRLQREWLHAYADAPVLSISAGDFNLISNDDDKSRFIQAVTQALGTQHA